MNQHGITTVYNGDMTLYNGKTTIYNGQTKTYYGPAASKEYVEDASNGDFYIEVDGNHNVYIYDETGGAWRQM